MGGKAQDLEAVLYGIIRKARYKVDWRLKPRLGWWHCHAATALGR